MQTVILIVKGFLIGIGKIIPGVSGSLIAVSLNVYDKMIDSIVNLFKCFKENSLFLFKICIGILISLALFSKIIDYFLKMNYVYTMAIFIGLFMGVIPNVLKKTNYNKKDILINLILIILIYLIKDINLSTKFILNTNFKYIYIIFLGIIDSATMIIPGISGTAIFMLLDVYEFILQIYSNLSFNNLFFFMFGLIIGVVIITKIVNKIINQNSNLFYKIISYLTVYSIFILFLNIFKYINCNNIIVFILLFVISFLISKKLDNM